MILKDFKGLIVVMGAVGTVTALGYVAQCIDDFIRQEVTTPKTENNKMSYLHIVETSPAYLSSGIEYVVEPPA